MNYPEEKEQYNVLCYFLNDIPGLTDAEIRKNLSVNLSTIFKKAAI